MNKPPIAANDMSARLPCSLGSELASISVPEGHIGPVLLSETGRLVWWTGRVAIGLRYEPLSREVPHGQYAEWLQDVLLASRPLAKCA